MAEQDIFAGLDLIPEEEQPLERRQEDPMFPDLIEPERDKPSGNPFIDIYQASRNIPSNVVSAGKAAYDMATDPVGVVRAIGDVGVGVGEKIRRGIQEFQVGTDLPPNQELEMPADVAWEGIKEDWGSWEAIWERFINEPLTVGFEVGGPGGALVKPLRALDVSGLPKLVSKKTAQVLDTPTYRSALDLPAEVPRQTLRPDSPGVDDLVETGLRERVTLDRPGLEVARQVQKDAEGVINKVIADGDYTDFIPVEKINKNLDELARSYEGTSGGNAKIAKVRDQQRGLYEEFAIRHPDTGEFIIDQATGQPYLRSKITPSMLQKYKTKAYEDVYAREATSPQKAANAKTAAIRQQARGAKEELTRIYPELIDPNMDWANIAKLKPWAAKAANRGGKDSPIPGYSFIKETVTSPKWKSNAAVWMRKYAEGDLGWLEKTLNSHELRTVLILGEMQKMRMEEETNREY